jgi:O-antigen biosynthesis protein WbqP
MRRSGEFLVALILLLLSAALMLLIALVIRWEGPGPVFQTRQRIGRDGRRFAMLSFRTQTYDPGQQRFRWETTRVGHFLHHTRFEALPQLINVLRGEMSFPDMTLFD